MVTVVCGYMMRNIGLELYWPSVLELRGCAQRLGRDASTKVQNSNYTSIHRPVVDLRTINK